MVKLKHNIYLTWHREVVLKNNEVVFNVVVTNEVVFSAVVTGYPNTITEWNRWIQKARLTFESTPAELVGWERGGTIGNGVEGSH